ncbi:NAD(+) diphosphatase [Microvirga terrae]|uniref:NAD(+) diphosphatase n=1 Tax=Microvirga terrae TaxID=2740529 RepID=A0ABY5RTP7_9HYPH|nr:MULTISPECIES: NAD(+) diphosphatase [Microvirga]MBQ0823247.1 NAD(+) diphosphatase [Microvirga sp. HBU67558]UVF20621.1 NAD(+) diphosphatase [Microvirga terrae]
MTGPIAYISNPLVRHSAERDPEALAKAASDPDTAMIVLAGDLPVLQAGEPGTSLLPVSVMNRLPAHQEQVFLGTLNERPVVATLAAPDAAELFQDDPAFAVVDLRSIAVRGLVPAEELGMLAMAKSLLDWHRRHRFCANCGAPTQPTQAGFRRDCAACGAQHFPRTDPVVIMLITRGDKCLMGRQPRFAEKMYSCLAGFLEPGETIEDAVRRETFEEAGIRVGAVRYMTSQPWPFPSNVMIGCIGEALTEDIAFDGEELEDARWFSKDDVRLMLEGRHEHFAAPAPIAIANHLVREWVKD